jgi:hypothetical protein
MPSLTLRYPSCLCLRQNCRSASERTLLGLHLAVLAAVVTCRCRGCRAGRPTALESLTGAKSRSIRLNTTDDSMYRQNNVSRRCVQVPVSASKEFRLYCLRYSQRSRQSIDLRQRSSDTRLQLIAAPEAGSRNVDVSNFASGNKGRCRCGQVRHWHSTQLQQHRRGVVQSIIASGVAVGQIEWV